MEASNYEGRFIIPNIWLFTLLDDVEKNWQSRYSFKEFERWKMSNFWWKFHFLRKDNESYRDAVISNIVRRMIAKNWLVINHCLLHFNDKLYTNFIVLALKIWRYSSLSVLTPYNIIRVDSLRLRRLQISFFQTSVKTDMS